MADTNKKEYASNLHPKGDLDTTVYPNVKSENIIDKDTTAYTDGKVPDSSLVSKSLDGLNEKIETNKIQTDTNKTNIATLQVDVSSLKQDNQTTKTTIAGLVSSDTTNKANIAKNTQDIENLSAVMPTDINVDAKGYAILEHDGTEITGQTKKVKFAQTDNSASFSEVTIPTATALKTKDGTSFGGGSKLYNGAEYLPTFDIATLKDTYVDLSTNQTIYGDKKFMSKSGTDTYFRIGYNPWGPGYAYPHGIGLQGKNGSLITFTPGFADLNSKIIISGNPGFIGLGSGFLFKTTYETTEYNIVEFDVPLNNTISFSFNSAIIKMSPKNLNSGMALSKDSGSTWTEYALTSDLDAKQDKRFVHTVEIHYASNGSYFCFTGTSDKNTPIDSVEKLTNVFANRTFAGTGIFGSAGLSKIHVGSSVNNTTFKKYMNNGEYTNPSEETFAMVFNTTGFTITDSVSAL